MAATEVRERHTVVVASAGSGLVLECAWCELVLTETPQSARLEELAEVAEAHYAEIEAEGS